ncbi:MAG: CoA transferase subunit A [Geminicoccaceae bacterium]
MSKLASLEHAVRDHLQDGDTVFVGGFGQCIPYAIGHEIVRQGRRDLVLCRSGADIFFDLLIAAGCVAKVIVGYLGNPGIGLAHAFRRAAEGGTIEVEDWTNFAMVLRLHAAALGVPFLPAATMAGGDLPAAVNVRTVTCPYSGEELSAIPALQPDVALLHAQCADVDGNLQLFGLPGDSVEGALASRKVIATVEEIVAPETIRRRPDRTVVPGFRVAAVSHVPFGAYPAYVDGYYGRDDQAYEEWDALARDAAALGDWIEKAIRNTPDFASYLETVGPARLQAMADVFGRIAGAAP